jgi:dienelactone hydrolase
MQPLARYHQIYEGEPRRFAAPTGENPHLWAVWRSALSTRLRELLGLGAIPPAALDARAEAPTSHRGYRREFVSFTSEPGVTVPGWLLVPEGEGPRPAVIAVHGHGTGVDDIVGINPDGSEREEPTGYHQNFAVSLCRRGFVVLAPEVLGFGRRRDPEDVAADPGQSSCYNASLWGMMLGRPLLGRRVAEVSRALDYLATRPEVDTARVGIMGISGGGMVTLFSAALDERLQAVAVSGYLSTFRDSILSIRHCLCNYVPGLLAEAEMYDLAALLAPRPLVVEAGIHDPIFPISSVRHSYEQVQRAYALLGAEDRLASDFFEGDHRISGAVAYDFLWRWLGQP